LENLSSVAHEILIKKSLPVLRNCILSGGTSYFEPPCTQSPEYGRIVKCH